MRGPLRRVAHNRRRVGFKVADIAVGRANEHCWIGAGWIVLQVYRSVVCPAVIGPRDAFFVERFADRADIGGWDRTAAGDAGGVNRAVREEAGGVVVNHIVVAWYAVGVGMVR